MSFLAVLIGYGVNLCLLIIIAQVGLSWLMAFEVVNEKNEAAQNLSTLLKKATDPVYKPLRKYVPPVGGIDITPLVVIIGLQIISGLLISILT